jgi:DNA-binding winged helix-turn-helix (wHTH) protein/TolB-like protein
MPSTIRPRIRFGDFEADTGAGELRRRGEIVRLQDLPFRLLAALLVRPGQLVTREELCTKLWGEATFVDYDAGLNTAIAKLREALADPEDAAGRAAFIETVPKRGYRFVARTEIVKNRSPSEPSERSDAGGYVRSARWRVISVATVVGVVLLASAGYAAYRSRAVSRVSIAVALFDNETGRPEFDRVAQALTDSAVVKLASDPRLAVIGNAAILRTPRPFMDLQAIRDRLHVDYIIVGQVQRTGDAVSVLTHLIRADDQTHVWVDSTPVAGADAAALGAAVADNISRAVAAKALK